MSVDWMGLRGLAVFQASGALRNSLLEGIGVEVSIGAIDLGVLTDCLRWKWA